MREQILAQPLGEPTPQGGLSHSTPPSVSPSAGTICPLTRPALRVFLRVLVRRRTGKFTEFCLRGDLCAPALLVRHYRWSEGIFAGESSTGESSTGASFAGSSSRLSCKPMSPAPDGLKLSFRVRMSPFMWADRKVLSALPALPSSWMEWRCFWFLGRCHCSLSCSGPVLPPLSRCEGAFATLPNGFRDKPLVNSRRQGKGKPSASCHVPAR